MIWSALRDVADVAGSPLEQWHCP